jgi:hypothetical protein
MTGGRRVDDDLVVRADVGQSFELDEADELVDSGEREREQPVDVLVIEVRAPRGDRVEGGVTRSEPTAERAVRIELRGVELSRRASDAAGLGAEAVGECVREGVGRIGRDDQHPSSLARRSNGGGRGACGLADSALAAEEGEPRTCHRVSHATTVAEAPSETRGERVPGAPRPSPFPSDRYISHWLASQKPIARHLFAAAMCPQCWRGAEARHTGDDDERGWREEADHSASTELPGVRLAAPCAEEKS